MASMQHHVSYEKKIQVYIKMMLCFRALSVSSPVSDVTSIGNMGAN